MAKEVSKSINLRVTLKEKDQLDRMAQARNQTLKDIILNGTVYSKEHETTAELLQLKEDLADLEKVKQQQQGLQHEIQRLEALLSSKNETITVLEDQLEQANKRIDDYSRQLEQQQSLQLGTVQINRDLQLKIDTLEDQPRKGFFSRLFSGN